MKNIGIVGYGYWGKNLVRNFKVLSSCEVKYVCEKDPDLAAKCKELYSAIKVVPDYETLLNDDALDGIVIATPVDTHYAFAKLSLENFLVLLKKYRPQQKILLLLMHRDLIGQ